MWGAASALNEKNRLQERTDPEEKIKRKGSVWAKIFVSCMCFAVLEPLNISPVRFFLNVSLHKKVTKLYISKLSLIHVTHSHEDLCSHFPLTFILSQLPTPFGLVGAFYDLNDHLESMVPQPRAGLRWGPVTLHIELAPLKTGWSSRSWRSFQKAQGNSTGLCDTPLSTWSLTHSFVVSLYKQISGLKPKQTSSSIGWDLHREPLEGFTTK